MDTQVSGAAPNPAEETSNGTETSVIFTNIVSTQRRVFVPLRQETLHLRGGATVRRVKLDLSNMNKLLSVKPSRDGEPHAATTTSNSGPTFCWVPPSGSSPPLEVLLPPLFGLDGVEDGLPLGVVALTDLLDLLLHLRVQRGEPVPQLLHRPRAHLEHISTTTSGSDSHL